MKALQFDEFGAAEKVLKLVDLPEPGSPGPGEVRVQMRYSPLNFHDLLRIGGYVAPPPLPAVAGNEGIRRVLAAGEGVAHVAPGNVVVLPLLLGTWRERLIAPAAGLAPLPGGDLQQYSMFIFAGAFDYAAKIAPVITEAVPLLQSGALRVPVAAVYDFTDIADAVAHLERGGKILLLITN